MQYEAPAIIERIKLTVLLYGKGYGDSPKTLDYQH